MKVPWELIQLQQKVCIGIDIFFVNGHIFFMTFSRKICFTTVTHLIKHKVSDVWAAMHKIYQMYLLRGFHIVEIAGDGEFAWIADQVASLPTNPVMDLAAASQHVGLIERNIRFLKEKTHLICHSLPFERIPALMLVRMVLHSVQFMNSFPRKGGLKHYPPSAIMTGAQLHMSQLQLKFGTYCQVAEDVTPCNSLAACTWGAISLGPSGNLSGGQHFLALDTGKMIVQNRWKELPMPSAVINCVNLLGHAERPLLVFTDRHGRVIGDYTPNDYTPNVGETYDALVLSIVNDFHSPVSPLHSEMPGVFLGEEGDADELPGVDAPDVAIIPEPTGVDMDGFEAEPSQEETVFDSAAFDTAVDGGLEEQVAETNNSASPKVGMAARNARVRNPPKQYVPNMKGNKYQVALAQITTSLGTSDRSMAFAQMTVKLMSKGFHRRADIVGMVMAQVSLKAALEKWGKKLKRLLERG
jgi:hypothetical protein